MNDFDPRGGVGRRVLSALVLLLAISYGAHLIERWLSPLAPLLIAGVVLIGVYRLIRGRRWWR